MNNFNLNYDYNHSSTWKHRGGGYVTGLPISSNIAEVSHLGFKSLVQCTKPTLWTFLDALKLEQGLTDQKIADRLMCVASADLLTLSKLPSRIGCHLTSSRHCCP